MLGWFLVSFSLVSWSSFNDNDIIPSLAVGVSAFQPKTITTSTTSLSANHQYKHFRHGAIGSIITTTIDDKTSTRYFMSLLDDEQETSSSSMSSSSSLSFAMDPTSEMARTIVREKLKLSSEQHQQLAKLAVLVNDWNSRINLISRKDCSKEVVFGRHILPSLAPLAMLTDDDPDDDTLVLSPGQRVCDVGTGGGFPGLPLAIARPDVDFLLVDSVGKKITAVQDMADQLGLTNVKTHHGRAESVSGFESKDNKKGDKFAWVVGRSVTSLPTFAFWVHHLLQKNDGRLVYLIGGDIDDTVSDQAILDEDIENVLDVPGISDKRVLVFSQQSVDHLAKNSGEKLRVPTRGSAAGDGSGKSGKNKNDAAGSRRQRNKKKETAKGQWAKRDSSTSKQRGYDDFQRFDSLQK
ncbi:MAG: 16S rRNA (guanine527-N7)-methyltransferase [Bacillariaceae sp.]|jgi:16S rRNA (guanine527-N7)-methyltransferase